MGERTEQIVANTTQDMRLNELERRITALENKPVFYQHPHFKYVVGACVVVLLALMGWSAGDVKGLIS
jgi:hypothetical protein